MSKRVSKPGTSVVKPSLLVLALSSSLIGAPLGAQTLAPVSPGPPKPAVTPARPKAAATPVPPGALKPAPVPGAPRPLPAGAPRPPAAAGAARPARPLTAKPALLPPGTGPVPVPAPPAPGPKPSPELDQLKFLRGRWRCAGVQFANALYGPEHRFVATAESKAAIDGFWDQFTYEELRSKEHHGYRAQGLWGWDQGNKRLVRTAATNVGDWDSGSAPGLEGDKIVWSGEVAGSLGHTAYRHTITKKTDREWSQSLELKDATGKYAPINEVICKH